VKFKITAHSGFIASARPGNAVDLLWERLGAVSDDVAFARAGDGIVATWEQDAPTSMEQDERAEIGRRTVFEIVRDVCERSPELDLEWFAVGFFR